MKPLDCPAGHIASEGSGPHTFETLLDELLGLRASMLGHAKRLGPSIAHAGPVRAASATNLAHYLALRSVDIRHLQDRLSRFGLSSLGRAEADVLSSVDRVIDILHRLAGQPAKALEVPMGQPPAGSLRGCAPLEEHAGALFGPEPPGRGVRIMVTLPAEAAHDDALVSGLVSGGMDVARINCAHDSAGAWGAMAERVRRAALRAGRPVRILMDLAGPKLRTGPVASGPAVLKLKPMRDAFGCVTAPGRLGLRAIGSSAVIPGATCYLGVDADWLGRLGDGEHVDLTDARAAHRRFTVVARCDEGVLVECARTVYLTGDTRLRVHRRGQAVHETRLGDVPARPGQLRLQRGQTLRLVASGVGHDAIERGAHRHAEPATIACTLPEALALVRPGDAVWFDDGRIGGVVLRQSTHAVDVQITHARDGGENLAGDKGIKLPDTALRLPALTPKDLADLQVAARTADMVGLSFAQSAADVRQLQRRLAELGAAHLGLILKIETRRGFEHLPEMLFAAMAGPAAGVMISRGDLAVECGHERLAEVQEEILWACEAAHMPVVWATQVLESMAKTGLPSRAEIPDAATGERAECVMLNKGPHILDAMRTLDDILRRMQAHQSKKRPLLRALKAWPSTAEGGARAPAASPVADTKTRHQRATARACAQA